MGEKKKRRMIKWAVTCLALAIAALAIILLPPRRVHNQPEQHTTAPSVTPDSTTIVRSDDEPSAHSIDTRSIEVKEPEPAVVPAYTVLPPPVLKDVLLQEIPGMGAAWRGPDSRTWWQMRSFELHEDVRIHIAGEFNKPSPVLPQMTSPVLFEPNGRVWFSSTRYGHNELLGYDGRRWIERPSPPRKRIKGAAPYSARNVSGYNCICGDTLFFISTDGILCFDTKTETWSEQNASGGWFYRKLLLPEQDGKGVVAVFLEPIVKDNHYPGGAIWRWRDGEWSEMAVPPDLAKADVHGVSITPDGIWTNERGTHRRPDGSTFEGRALRFTPFDPDRESIFGPDTEIEMRIGPFTARGVVLTFDEYADLAFYGAKQISRDGRLLGKGMLVERRSSGKVVMLSGEHLIGERRYTDDFWPAGHFLVPGGNAIWINRNGDLGSRIAQPSIPAGLYSLETGLKPAEVDCNIITVLADGTAIGYCVSDDGRTRRVVAYKHGAKDDRTVQNEGD
ncbi:MAG TPA: DUF1668 domain-containing protein [Planctomycetota bacterium]|nr:DUF1668 domain-containing protein [Planctomycetota bacterium]